MVGQVLRTQELVHMHNEHLATQTKTISEKIESTLTDNEKMRMADGQIVELPKVVSQLFDTILLPRTVSVPWWFLFDQEFSSLIEQR